MITEFKEYSELPFSKDILAQLFLMHTHAELVKPDQIVYTETDVLILLQMMQDECKKMINEHKGSN